MSIVKPGVAAVSALLVGALVVAGCGARPTYPKAQIAATIQQMLTEAGLDATVKYLEHTLGVQVTAKGVLAPGDDEYAALGPEFDDVLRKALDVLHRVLLSSDAPVHFYVLLVADPDVPNVYLTMVRYMDDVRRVSANMLGPTEIWSRTIFEPTRSPAPLSLQDYLPRDITLQEFLSWQIARRIQSALVDVFRDSGTVNVGRCAGMFQNREFVVTLNVVPLQEGALDDTTLQEIVATSSSVAAKVLTSYEFEGFDAIRFRFPQGQTGVDRVLPRTRLNVFR